MSGGGSRRVWAVAVGCAVVAALALWLTFFRESDEQKIRRTLGDLATIVSVKEGDTLLSRTARLRSRLPDVVDDDVRVDIAELDMRVRGRAKLADDAAKAGLMFQSADCAFTTVEIKIDPAGTVARADAVALVTAVRGGERRVDKRDVHFLLRQDAGWKVTSIDVAPPKPE